MTCRASSLDRWFTCRCGNIIDPRAGDYSGFFVNRWPYCSECGRNISKDFLRYGLVSLVTHYRVKYHRSALHEAVEIIYQRYLRVISKRIGVIDESAMELINKRFREKRHSCGDYDLGRNFYFIDGPCIYHSKADQVKTINWLLSYGYINQDQASLLDQIYKTERKLNNEFNKSRAVGAKKSGTKSTYRRSRQRKSKDASGDILTNS